VAPTLFLLSLLLLPTGRFNPSLIFLSWLLVIPVSWFIQFLRRRRDARTSQNGMAVVTEG
jgi:hypothetical protein